MPEVLFLLALGCTLCLRLAEEEVCLTSALCVMTNSRAKRYDKSATLYRRPALSPGHLAITGLGTQRLSSSKVAFVETVQGAGRSLAD